jgi:hypothetical protein
MEDFEKNIFGCTSLDHAEREFAERFVEMMKNHDPVGLSASLLHVMGKDESTLTHLAAVLYRKIFIETFNPNQDPSAKEKLIQLIQPFRSFSFLKKVSEILVVLGNNQHFSNEILSLATVWISSGEDLMKVLAFYVVGIATQQTEMLKIIEVNRCSVFELLWKGLNDPDENVKLSSSTAACQVLIWLNFTQEHCKLFSMVLDGLPRFQKVEIFEIIAEVHQVINMHPKIISALLQKIVLVLSSVAKDNRADRASRSAAVEVFIMIINEYGGFVEKSRFFVQEALTLAMVFMSELDCPLNFDEWNSNVDDGVTRLEPFDVGKDLLSAVSDNFKELAFHDALQMVDAHLAAPHWIYQHTGIVALGLISEGCKNCLLGYITKYIQVLLGFCTHDNPRLRFAALTSISLFCTYFSPEIQQNYHQVIMNAILFNIQPGQLSRPNSQALKSIINFCIGVIPDTRTVLLDPYIPSLIIKFESLLHDPSTPLPVLESLLNSLSVLIKKSSSPDLFTVFLPKLLKIFYLPGIQSESLKLEAMICLGSILEKTNFQETSGIFNEILKIKSGMSETEEHYNKILEIISKKVAITKDPQLLSDLMDELLKNAQVSVEFAVFDTDSADSNLLRGIILEVNNMTKKKISLNTSAMKIKSRACVLLEYLVRKLKEKTQPWMFKILECMKHLLDFNINAEIRKFSLMSIVSVFRYADKTSAKEMFLNVSPYLLAIIQNKISKDQEDLKNNLKAFLEISKSLECLNFLSLQGAGKVSEILSSCFRVVVRSKEKRETSQKEQKFNRINEDILKTCVELIGILLKSFKIAFLPIFEQYFQGLVGELLYKQSPSDLDLLAGLNLFSFYIESTGDLMCTNEGSLIIAELLKYSYHKSIKVRKSAVSVMGQAAIHGERLFTRYVQPCIEACNFLINLPEAFTEDLLRSTECAVATLGKIAVTYRDDLIPVWLKFLPLKSNAAEAHVMKELFFKHFEKIQRFESSVEVSRILRNEVMV